MWNSGLVMDLTATQTLRPRAGQTVLVEQGRVLVFALSFDGRRLPFTVVEAGEIVVGCHETDEAELLLAGLPGSVVRLGTLDDDAPTARLERWVERLGQVSGHGEWPRGVRTLIAVEETDGWLEEGEHVVSDNDASRKAPWVRVAEGTVLFCGLRQSGISSEDCSMPLGSRAWLTASTGGAQLVVVEPPTRPEDWTESLDLIGQLSIDVVLQQQKRIDAGIGARVEAVDEIGRLAVAESIDTLAASVHSDIKVPALSDPHRSAEFAAAVAAARAIGLRTSDEGLLRAAAEAEAGREPITAVGDVFGARSRQVLLRAGWRDREGTACVAWKATDHDEHPVALFWRRGWVAFDPLSGVESPVDDALAEALTTRATELLPVLPSAPARLKDLGRIAIRGVTSELAMIGFLTALIAAASFATPFLLGRLADLFAQQAPSSAFIALYVALGMVLAVTAIWQLVRSYSLLRARARIVAVASGALIERTIRQPGPWHRAHDLGSRQAQAAAASTASSVLPDDTVARLLDSAVVLGSLAAIATVSSSLLVAIAALLGAEILVLVLLLRRYSRKAAQRVEAQAMISGRLLEILRAVNRIKVAGAESRAFLRWAQLQASFTRADQSLRRVSRVQGVLIAVMPLLGLLVIVAVTGVAAGSFQDFITAQVALTGATTAVAAASIASGAGIVARRTLNQAAPVLASVPEGGDQGDNPGLISGGIEVRDLVFRYAPGLPPVLDGVSLSVKPGEHVAIVGPSGCGKTSLVRILLGLDDAESGSILIDGRDMASLNRPAVRRQIGSVMQSSNLLPGPIRANIDMGRGLTNADMWTALGAAAVEADVRAMPMGLDTPVTDGGSTISGGQRQRLLIARALAGNPRMLVLDEATSALDNITQAAVVESLQSLRLTRIVVAHRLSTIQQADRIIVMVAGKVVDQGTYQELYERPGPFRELVMRQEA